MWCFMTECMLCHQFAAHKLIEDARTWEERENAMVAAAKRMARLMMLMSKFARLVAHIHALRMHTHLDSCL